MIWNAFSQASGPKGTLFQMLVQAAELFLLFANLMPLLPSAYNVFLKSKAEADDVVAHEHASECMCARSVGALPA